METICLFHNGMRGIVCVDEEQSPRFPNNHGTKHGCVLEPNLFIIFLTVVLIKMKLESSKSVYIELDMMVKFSV